MNELDGTIAPRTFLGRASRRIVRRGLLLAVAAAGVMSALPTAALAQAYPTKPVRIVIPYAPGGGADNAARLLATALSKELGQSFVVDPKPGANTAIAAVAVAHSPPDGYTLLLTGNATTVLNPLMLDKMPYDPDKEFAPVSVVTRSPFLLVASTTLGANTFNELLDVVRKKPGELAYASNGTGGIIHIGMELFSQRAGLKLNHVPYKGFSPALPDIGAGRTPITMIDLGALGSLASSGMVKILATTSATRSQLFPEVPAISELGFPGYQLESWFTVYAPAGTPASVIDTLNASIRKWAADPATAKALVPLGQEPASSSPAEVRARIQREREAFAPLVKAANIKMD